MSSPLAALFDEQIALIESQGPDTEPATILPPLRATLKRSRDILETRFSEGDNVVDLIHARAKLVDAVLLKLWKMFFPDESGFSLVAVGGYGRGELHPCSDVDLMILTKRRPNRKRTENLEKFLAFLWDTGLAVGHSVRTITDCEQAARQDVTIATALMESRLLAGDSQHFKKMRVAIAADKIWPADEFFAAKLSEQRTRHAKYDDTAYNLEPNVKEGPGGIRDIQNIAWVAKRHFAANTLHDLVTVGFLTEPEFIQLRDARNFLWRVRLALHLLTDRSEDRLLFDYQPTLAKRFGFLDTSHSLAVEQFMQEYYRTVMEVNRLNEMLLELYEEAILLDPDAPAEPVSENFQERNGFLEARSENTFRQNPSALLELFLLLQENPGLKGVSATTIRLVRRDRELVNEDFRQDPVNQRLFIDILGNASGVTHELRRMNRYGILGRYLPEFGWIVGRMQFDLFHAYTVDEHTLFVVSNLRRFSLSRFDHEFPDCSKIMQSLEKPVLAYLAGLFHDIAKGRGGDHSALGAKDAEKFCTRHGFSRYESRLVSWLVRHHLLLSVTAQKKDISDPKVVLEFAKTVGDKMHLDYLYVLTVADVRATNPSLWNSWKASLFRDLYERTQRALRQGLENPIDKQELIRETKNAALKRLSGTGIKEDAVKSIWSKFGDEYFLLFTDHELAWQAEVLLDVKDDSTPTIRVLQQTDRGVTAVFVFASDTGRIFPRATGCLVQLGLNIVDARVVSLGGNLTVHTYHVLEDTGRTIRESNRVDFIQNELQKELARKGSKPSPVSRHVPRQARMFSTPTNIEIHKDEANSRTIVDVSTGDEPGLLSKIGEVFDDCEIRIQNARITTVGERAEDVFFVTGPNGMPIIEESKLARLKSELHMKLEGQAA